MVAFFLNENRRRILFPFLTLWEIILFTFSTTNKSSSLEHTQQFSGLVILNSSLVQHDGDCKLNFIVQPMVVQRQKKSPRSHENATL